MAYGSGLENHHTEMYREFESLILRTMDKLKEYLRKEFIYNTVPKYYKYFEEWFNNLTKNQLVYYTAYMNGCKTPY